MLLDDWTPPEPRCLRCWTAQGEHVVARLYYPTNVVLCPKCQAVWRHYGVRVEPRPDVPVDRLPPQPVHESAVAGTQAAD